MAKNIYVNNQDFLDSLIQYKSEKLVDPKTKIPDFVGECLLKIANHLSFKPNFIGYTFREEMIGDAIENCLVYLDNFNPEKSSNPFAYFTQIIYYAFLRRIEREKKQSYIRYKMIEKSDILNDSQFNKHELSAGSSQDYPDYLGKSIKFFHEHLGHIVTEFEEKKLKKRNKLKAKKQIPIEDMI